ncbi:MAG: pyridoxamine 5'-phosphate oxidase family protein [Clostridia bacterium]|nr:pyridoxamine 5'-phosphate oxidase family protein [Clostridia bacterium]
MTEKIKKDILSLLNSSRNAIVCSVDDQGVPAAKAMYIHTNNEPGVYWFSTNTSSVRVGHFRQRPQSSVYIYSSSGLNTRGLLITGTMEICQDDQTKKAFWKPTDRIYYPKGPTDPDYCMLRFTPNQCNYYHNLQKCMFAYEELLR